MHKNNALQPSHLAGRFHWDTFLPFWCSCGKTCHRWYCTEPLVNTWWLLALPLNKRYSLSSINISIIPLYMRYYLSSGSMNISITFPGIFVILLLLPSVFSSWALTRVYPRTGQVWNLQVTRWWIIKIQCLETSHDHPQVQPARKCPSSGQHDRFCWGPFFDLRLTLEQCCADTFCDDPQTFFSLSAPWHAPWQHKMQGQVLGCWWCLF